MNDTTALDKRSPWLKLVVGAVLTAAGFFGRDVVNTVRTNERKATTQESVSTALSRDLSRLEAAVQTLETSFNQDHARLTTALTSSNSELRKEIDHLWRELLAIRGKLPAKFPPESVMSRIEKLEDRIHALEVGD